MPSALSHVKKENNDSDNSVSEEEDLNGDRSGNWISISNPVEEKGDLPVDVLRGAQILDSATLAINFSQETQNNIRHEDEIEYPAFDNGDDPILLGRGASESVSNEVIICFPNAASLDISDEEIISDDNVSRPNANRIRRSFPSLVRKEDLPLLRKDKNAIDALMVVKPTEKSNNTAHKHRNKSITELLEDYCEKVEQSANPEMPIDAVIHHGNVEHSMADFLDCFQERSGLPQPNLKKRSTKRKSRSLGSKRSMSLLGDRKDDDFMTESLYSRESSSDEEDLQNLKSIAPGKTMADQFQEVLGAVSSNDAPCIALPRQLNNGLLGRLQRVIQNEKETEMLFLKKLHTDASSRGESCNIHVKILSRSLEAKLTVCSCALVGNEESCRWMNDCKMRQKSGRPLTVIFTSKTCSDVELEVGNVIRIYHPWKEVKVRGNDEVIMLSSYFSQIWS